MKRKRFSEEQIIRILHEAERGELGIADICRKYGVSEQSYCKLTRRQFVSLYFSKVITYL